MTKDQAKALRTRFACADCLRIRGDNAYSDFSEAAIGNAASCDACLAIVEHQFGFIFGAIDRCEYGHDPIRDPGPLCESCHTIWGNQRCIRVGCGKTLLEHERNDSRSCGDFLREAAK